MSNQEKPSNSMWPLEAAVEFSKRNPIWAFTLAVVILVLVLQGTGFIDRIFNIEEQKLDQTYDLQVRTMNFLEEDVMDKLDDIYERLDTAEDDIEENKEDIQSIEQRVSDLEEQHED